VVILACACKLLCSRNTFTVVLVGVSFTCIRGQRDFEITVMIGLISYLPKLPWLCCSSAQLPGRLSSHATSFGNLGLVDGITGIHERAPT